MKNKILMFIIGVLVGAIIATAGFYIYEKKTMPNSKFNGERPQMVNRGDGEEILERPSGERGERNKGTSSTDENSDNQV